MQFAQRLIEIDNRMSSARIQCGTEDGQTMIEYGLIVALIAVVAILVLSNVGVNVTSLFTTASKNLHS